jgi:hypothetical protein
MMTPAMHKRMNRILHQHDWATLEELVRTLEELAALSENEIEALLDSRDQQVRQQPLREQWCGSRRCMPQFT